MPKFNLQLQDSLENTYESGLLPQRNDKKSFYSDSSCRSNLAKFKLSSENRRIIRKTEDFEYQLIPIKYSLEIQKQIFMWLKDLKWDFPINSVKKIFTDHIFNYIYIWKKNDNIVAYSVCYFDSNFSHIAYVFYDPIFSHSELPIRLVIQAIIDSHQKNLKYCYLGRFSADNGYYKRNMPGFEFFQDNRWQSLK